MHPSLVTLLLNQLSERNRSYCSQITSVFLNLLIGAYAEMPRSQWIAVCIDPIVEMVYASPDEGKVHLIERMESRHGIHTLEHAEALGIGSQQYELVDLDK